MSRHWRRWITCRSVGSGARQPSTSAGAPQLAPSRSPSTSGSSSTSLEPEKLAVGPRGIRSVKHGCGRVPRCTSAVVGSRRPGRSSMPNARWRLARQAGSTDLELEMGACEPAIAYTYLDQRQTITILRELISGPGRRSGRPDTGSALMFHPAPGRPGASWRRSLAAIGDFHEAAAIGAEAVPDRGGARPPLQPRLRVPRRGKRKHALRGDPRPGAAASHRGAWSFAAPWAPGSSCPGRPHSWELARAPRGADGRRRCAGLDEAVERGARRPYDRPPVDEGGRPPPATSISEGSSARPRRRSRARPPASAGGGHPAWALRTPRRDRGRVPTPPKAATAEAPLPGRRRQEPSPRVRPLVAHCHLGLGTLYRRTGDRAKAKEHLATATTMYREMGMTFWLEKADAELGGVER